MEQLSKIELVNSIKLMDEQIEAWDNNKINLYKPHPGQLKFHQSPKKVRLMVSGNRFGKTCASVIEALWLCLGIHPYHKRSLPCKGKLYAVSYGKVIETIIPKIEQYLPKSALDARKPYDKNQMGQITSINFANGSKIRIGSYDQELMKAEGSDYDFVAFDEPPSRELYVAEFRGTVDRNGLMWFSMTPLNEPWIYDDLWVPGESGKKPYIACFSGNSYDNPHVSKDALDLFSSELTKDEKSVRIEGHFKRLQGLVVKTYEPEYSDIEAFELDEHFSIYEGLDPHTEKPNCALWKAIDQDGFRYAVAELSCDGSIREFGALIAAKRDELRSCGANIVSSVSDTSINQKDFNKINQYDELKRSLEECGEALMPKLVNKRKSLDSSIKKLVDLFRVLEHGGWKGPTEYLFEDCVPNYRNELLHYQWPDNMNTETVKPKPKWDDFIACLETDIQILTKNGFKFYNEIKFEDKIGTVNLRTMDLEYDNPERIIIKNHNGDMIHIKNRLDCLVTPDHRMVVYNHPRSNEAKFVRADELKLTYQIPLTINWSGDDSNEFILPGIIKKTGNSYKKSKDIKLNKEIFFEFLGWYVSEGYLGNPQFPGHGWQIGICQSDINFDKKKQILSCMKHLGFLPTKLGKSGYSFSNKQLWHWLKEHCGRYSYGKKVPQIVKDASPRLQEIFWKSAMLGDGSIHGSKEHYYSISTELLYGMQEILLKMGFSSSLLEREPHDFVIRGKKYFKENCQRSYVLIKNTKQRISLADRKRLSSEKQPTTFKLSTEKIFYDGIVWCVSVPNGAFVARNSRNGLCFVVGNCSRYIEIVAPKFQTPGQSAIVHTYKGAYSDRTSILDRR